MPILYPPGNKTAKLAGWKIPYLDEPRTVWVVTIKIEISNIEVKRNIAIVMNAATFFEATDIDYFITNVSTSIIKKLALGA